MSTSEVLSGRAVVISVHSLVATLGLLATIVGQAAARPPALGAGPALKPPAGCIHPVESAREQGIAAARGDLEQGVLKLKAFDRPATPVESIRVDLLAKRFGVRYEVVGGGTAVTPELEAHVRAYNEHVRKAIEAKHGKGLLDAVAAEARLIDEIKHAIGRRVGPAIDEAAAESANRGFAAGRARLIRVATPTAIDAVYDELLFRRLHVTTAVLKRPDPNVRRFVLAYNKWMRQRLVAVNGQRRWRRVSEEAVVTAADRDIATGVLRVKLFGMPMPSDIVYQRILKERFGIEVELGGCVLPTEYDVAPYNQRMREEIERRFGPGVLEKTQEEARRRQERRQEDPVALRCLTADEDKALSRAP
ncbi:MAG: hypothetical protein ACYS0G_06035 [Planctomycetota bacterium]